MVVAVRRARGLPGSAAPSYHRGVRPADEPTVLREYRHLLRTASADWQETAHRHALLALGPKTRSALLGEIHRLLQTGTHLGADDVHALARIVVHAERRRPRILLDGLHPRLLAQVAAAVVTSPTGTLLQAGIDVWDGLEPRRRPDPPVEPDHHQRWHAQRATPGLEGDVAAFLPTVPSFHRRSG